MKLNNDYLYVTTYKIHNNQIDEVFLYKRKGSKQKQLKISVKTQRFVIAENQKGSFYINYNFLKSDENVEYSDTSITLYVPHDGLIKTSLKEDTWGLIDGNIHFFRKQNNREMKLPFISLEEILNLNDNETLKRNYKLDSVYVCIEGFNQNIRNWEKNILFKEDIKGNVLMFKINTLRKLLISDFPAKRQKEK